MSILANNNASGPAAVITILQLIKPAYSKEKSFCLVAGLTGVAAVLIVV